MVIRRMNVLARLYRGPWMGISCGIRLLVPVLYYCCLISIVMVPEIQNTELQKKMGLERQMPVDSITQKERELNATSYSCETIHITLVCMAKCPGELSPMLKSLLMHRQNPLHFHLLVDTRANHVLSNLFDTWELPDVIYTCYDAESSLDRVRGIPSTHYSGVYPMVKLLYPDILPQSLTRVIALDTDLTILCDIAQLWTLFTNMTDDQFIGLAENQGDWYYINAWPAIGRGFNTGVMLLDLHKIRTHTNWTSLWQEALNENLPRLNNTTRSADQDVINAIITAHPSILYNVTWQYNVQISQHLYKYSRANRKKVKIFHWTSPAKYHFWNSDVVYFRKFHRSYVNFDGYLLRKKAHRCWQPQVDTNKVNRSDPCSDFRAAQRVKLRTHVYFVDYKYSNADSFDVTLVLQLSMDRLQFLERLLNYWEGPVSAAIYLADGDVNTLQSFIRKGSKNVRSRRNIGYHLVFKHRSLRHPVSYLRNAALENVGTPYVFLMDVEFVPMAGLYKRLRAAISFANPYPQKKCLVVPAFETQGYRASPPRSKAALLARLAGGDVAPFRAHEWPRGHSATSYSRWASAAAPYEVEWRTDYQPYFAVHRSVPKYDIRFSDFVWSKVSHVVELRAQGYKAVVLPGAFVVHTLHDLQQAGELSHLPNSSTTRMISRKITLEPPRSLSTLPRLSDTTVRAEETLIKKANV